MSLASPSTIAKKWQRNLQGATETIKEGVSRVTENPAELAIQSKQQWIDGLNRAAAEGKYERGLQRVTLQGWKDAMINKGLQRLSAGVAGALPKMEAFISEVSPHIESGVQQLRAMPRGSLEQNIQRSVFMQMHMSKFRRSR